jgi:integrase/recombinase XerD
MTQLRDRMLEELERRNYAPGTAKAYLFAVKQFAEHFHRAPDRLGAEHIREYQLYLFRERKLAAKTVSQRVAALRFFFVKTLKRHHMLEHLPFPRLPEKLPTVLSREEIGRLLAACTNRLHRTMLMTMYSTGVRRAELCQLKTTDIDSQRMMVHVHQGKGRRDRDLPLSPALLEELRGYWRWMKPKTFLFPGVVDGWRADVPISDKAVWFACQRAARTAGIEKHISPHTLRVPGGWPRVSAELLPVPYFHIVFTLPHEFSALILQNKRLLYDLLYLARYTHRVAISNHRLVAFENQRVSFRWKDYAHGGKNKIMTVPADEFLRRYLLHVLPKGLVRIRHFGLFANRCRAAALERCRSLLGSEPHLDPSVPADNHTPCPVCSCPMTVVQRITPQDLRYALIPVLEPPRALDSS